MNVCGCVGNSRHKVWLEQSQKGSGRPEVPDLCLEEGTGEECGESYA